MYTSRSHVLLFMYSWLHACTTYICPPRVWSWGWGVHGQLGLKTVDDKLLPSHVTSLDGLQVSYIAAGYGHSAVLTSHGQVLTFGNGEGPLKLLKRARDIKWLLVVPHTLVGGGLVVVDSSYRIAGVNFVAVKFRGFCG